MGEETGEELEEDSITFDNDGSPSTNAASQQDSEDDCKHEKIKGYYKGGYHPVLLGTLLNRRYHVIKKLGHGHFSTVWLTWDTKNKRLVACKIVKSQRSYTEAAIDEIAILERIREADQIDPDRQRCTQLLDQFIVKGINGIHVVMVMDVLGPNLLKFIRKYNYDEMGIEIVKPIVKQILQGLNYMHEKCNLVHTDIKPENLCFELSDGVIKRMALAAIEIQIAKQPIPKSHKSTLAGKFGDALENLPKDLKLAMKINAHNSKLNFEEQIPDDRYSLKMNELIENYKINEESLGAIVKPSLKNIKEDIERHYEDVDEETDTHDEIDWSTAKVKIADMGNAVRSTDKHDHTIQTKPYRSPEVILGIPYNETADIWSLACTVYEMITSAYLFKSRKLDKTWEEAHLTAIFDVLGPIPPYIALAGKNSKKYFDPKGIYKFAEELTIPKAIVETLIEKYDIPPEVANQLRDFLLPMLDYDVIVRAKASQCLKHIWLKESQ